MRNNAKLKIKTLLAVSVIFIVTGCSLLADKAEGSKGSDNSRAAVANNDSVKLLLGVNEPAGSMSAALTKIEDIINSVEVSGIKNGTRNIVSLQRVHNTSGITGKVSRSMINSIMSEEEIVQIAYDNLESEIEKALYRDFKFEVQKNIADEVISRLKKESVVAYVQVDNLNVLYDNPNDPYYRDGSLWGLNKTNCGSAWDITKGDPITVAVIDSGVDGNHPDLVNNLWSSPEGTWGYDFSDKDNTPEPDGSHGTHVAGTIAAVGNNGIGVVGVAPNVKIMACKIFPNAYSSVCADAIRYAVDNGAKVLNNSWGPRNRQESDPTIENAIRYAHSKGAIVIFAAGNSNDDAQYYYGGNSPYTICVAAVDSNFNKASFSNYGSIVDIAAPGVSIKSTEPNNSYGNKSGTSMAAPHIAGQAALILSVNPNFTYDQVLNKIKTTAISVSATNIGAGVMDAYASVKSGSGGDTEAPTVPGNFSSSNITSSSVDLSWSVSFDNTGVAGYRLYKDGSFLKSVSATSATISNLAANTTYQLSVSAYDAAGNESSKSSVSVTTLPGSGTTSWEPYVSYVTGDIVTQNGDTYSCRQSHTSLPGWEPSNVPALWLKQ